MKLESPFFTRFDTNNFSAIVCLKKSASKVSVAPKLLLFSCLVLLLIHILTA